MRAFGWIVLILIMVGLVIGIYFSLKLDAVKELLYGKPKIKLSNFILSAVDDKTNKQLNATYLLEKNGNDFFKNNLSEKISQEVTVASYNNYTLVVKSNGYYINNLTINKSHTNVTLAIKMTRYGNIYFDYNGLINQETNIDIKINVSGLIRIPLICISRTTDILQAKINQKERRISDRLLDLVDSCYYLKEYDSSNETINYPMDLKDEIIIKTISVISNVNCDNIQISPEYVEVWVVDADLVKDNGKWIYDYEDNELNNIGSNDFRYKIYGCFKQ